MNKLILAMAVLGVSFSANAFSADCKVIDVIDSSFFEEALSVEEYPEVKATDASADIGMYNFDVEGGDTFKVKPSVGFKQILEINSASGETTYTLIVNNAPNNKSGTLLGDNGEGQTLIAELDCN